MVGRPGWYPSARQGQYPISPHIYLGSAHLQFIYLQRLLCLFLLRSLLTVQCRLPVSLSLPFFFPTPPADYEEAAAAAVEAIEAGAAGVATSQRKTPKRICRFPGCNKTVKSQGACIRHGAKPKGCKVKDCPKQAQGNYDGMCKKCYNAIHNPKPPPIEEPPLEPTGQSVYDEIIPASVAWKAPKNKRAPVVEQQQHMGMPDPMMMPALPPIGGGGGGGAAAMAAAAAPAETPADVMPLIAHLRKYAHLEAGWHRKQERAARALPPPPGTSTQFETWERQRE